MSYPLSSPVSAGDATLASHYNNLRSDALFLGQSSANAIPVADLLERYESQLTIERLETNRLRVPATSSNRISLIISGYMVRALASVDLAAADAPSGSAGTYYVFANRADSSTTFTLSISTTSTEGSNQRRIGRFYWDGSQIVKDSIRTELSVLISGLLYFVEPQICQGRLSALTGTAVPTADVSSSATVYFTPYSGNRISLYVPGYGWRLYSFSELSLSVSGVAADTNLDIFIYDNAGTLTLSYTAWSNDSNRATALFALNGVFVKAGDSSYRYLGTVRTSASGVICDTKLKRFVWNYYNRIQRSLYVYDSTTSWTYAVRAWRSWNNSDDNRAQFVLGVGENPVYLAFEAFSDMSSSILRCVGIGLDSNTGPSSSSIWSSSQLASLTAHHAEFISAMGSGFHYLQLLEMGYTSPSVTWYGSYVGGSIQLAKSAALGYVMG
jgi:hypothetical protein